jgi:hypothetical protein
MWRWVWLFACGCLPDGYSTEPPPPRERDVLVQAIPGGTVIYQDGDGPWQLAPRVGERYGFDVEGERYAVALIDVQRQRVGSLYATVSSHPDVEWPVPPSVPATTHSLSGMISGMNGRSGRVAGRGREEILNATNDPLLSFAVELGEGPQTVAFARETMFLDGAEALVVRRDVVMANDRVENVDFAAHGVATQDVRVVRTGPEAGNCSLLSLFHFDDTAIILGGRANEAVHPDPESWRAGDRLEIRMTCVDSGDTDRLVFRTVENPAEIPASITAPYPAGNASLTVDQGRFRFEWWAPFEPVSSYVTTVGVCADCGPRWTAEISSEWLFGQLTIATVLSPPDLEVLGLLDPALKPTSGQWSVAAISGGNKTRFESRKSGSIEVSP